MHLRSEVSSPAVGYFLDALSCQHGMVLLKVLQLGLVGLHAQWMRCQSEVEFSRKLIR